MASLKQISDARDR